jgi:hypothetical protein
MFISDPLVLEYSIHQVKSLLKIAIRLNEPKKWIFSKHF